MTRTIYYYLYRKYMNRQNYLIYYTSKIGIITIIFIPFFIKKYYWYILDILGPIFNFLCILCNIIILFTIYILRYQ